jgi:hypothetical protein
MDGAFWRERDEKCIVMLCPRGLSLSVESMTPGHWGLGSLFSEIGLDINPLVGNDKFQSPPASELMMMMTVIVRSSGFTLPEFFSELTSRSWGTKNRGTKISTKVWG